MKPLLLAVATLLIACSEPTATATAELDQQNLLEGSLAGQGIGSYNDLNGAPGGGDQQSAQVFTVGITGRLTSVKVPLWSSTAQTAGATMEILGTTAGAPNDAQKLGEASIPASAVLIGSSNSATPSTWATFEFSGINVTAGQQLAFALRSTSTTGILYQPELTQVYALGKAYRRNKLVSSTWEAKTYTYLFQTYVTR